MTAFKSTRSSQEADPVLVGTGLALAAPLGIWFLTGPMLDDWGLRNGFFTTNAVLGLPGAQPAGTGPTLTAWSLLLALLIAIGAGAYIALAMTGVLTRGTPDSDRRRPTPPGYPVLVAGASTIYLTIGFLLTFLIPQPIPLVIAAALAAIAWMYTQEPLLSYLRRQDQINELEWRLLHELGFIELPSKSVVTVTKWTTDKLAEPIDEFADPENLETSTEPDVAERPAEFTLRYTGRKSALAADFRAKLNRITRSRFALTWDEKAQTVHCAVLPPEPANITRLRDIIAGPRLLRAGASVKDIVLDPGGELLSFAVRHRISQELAGNEGATQLIERRISDLLPGRWRARRPGGWDHTRDLARFERRPDLSTLVDPDVSSLPHNTTLAQVCARYDEICEIPYAINEDKEVITWKPKIHPHTLLTGPTGTGKTAAIHTIVAALAYFGFKIIIVDFKGMEYNSFRDWPNVTIVVAEVYEAVAVIHKVYKEMRERYRNSRGRAGKAYIADKEPWALVIDEYTEFQDRLDGFYKAHKPAKNAPRTCPTLEEVSSILRLGRTARIHCIVGLQRPDVTFLKGEARDNLTHRISLGKLSPEAAQMIWNEQWVGRTIPLGIRGRGNACDKTGRPVEVQVFYTPDPDTTDPDQQKILNGLRPPLVLHPRAVLLPPEFDPDTTFPPDKPNPSRPVEGEFAYYQDLPLLPADEYQQFDELSPLYVPQEWVEDSNDDSHDGLFANPGNYTIPAPATPATPEELVEAQLEEATIQTVTVTDLTIGDYFCVDPASDTWGTVATQPVDIDDDGRVAFYWRHDISGAETEIITPPTTTFTTKTIPDSALIAT